MPCWIDSLVLSEKCSQSLSCKLSDVAGITGAPSAEFLSDRGFSLWRRRRPIIHEILNLVSFGLRNARGLQFSQNVDNAAVHLCGAVADRILYLLSVNVLCEIADGGLRPRRIFGRCKIIVDDAKCPGTDRARVERRQLNQPLLVQSG